MKWNIYTANGPLTIKKENTNLIISRSISSDPFCYIISQLQNGLFISNKITKLPCKHNTYYWPFNTTITEWFVLFSFFSVIKSTIKIYWKIMWGDIWYDPLKNRIGYKRTHVEELAECDTHTHALWKSNDDTPYFHFQHDDELSKKKVIFYIKTFVWFWLLIYLYLPSITFIYGLGLTILRKWCFGLDFRDNILFQLLLVGFFAAWVICWTISLYIQELDFLKC